MATFQEEDSFLPGTAHPPKKKKNKLLLKGTSRAALSPVSPTGAEHKSLRTPAGSGKRAQPFLNMHRTMGYGKITEIYILAFYFF